MRNSQRAVVGALGFVTAVMVGVAAWIRLVAAPMPDLSGQSSTRNYDYSGFDRLDVNGQWEVTIERGDAWRVAIEVPAELAADVAVDLTGDELSFGFAGAWWFGGFGAGNGMKATITMPALESLDLAGASNVSFSGFDGPALTIDMSGAGEIRGVASRFDLLTLDMSGAGNASLEGVTVTNADIDTSGAGNVTLRMAGGRLTGEMSGAGNLEYFGTVSEQSVRSSGMVNIRRR